MELQRASEQIDAIWAHVARSEQFRGYRPLTVAVTGAIGLCGAILQPWIVPNPVDSVSAYLTFWITAAAACVLLVTAELLVSYQRAPLQMERQLIRRAGLQFLPCLAAGALLTWMLADSHPEKLEILPGLWAICFGLGISASLPFVTPKVGYVATYYFLAGGIALLIGRGEYAFHPWLMGGMFGVGQLLMAGILYGAEGRDHAQE